MNNEQHRELLRHLHILIERSDTPPAKRRKAQALLDKITEGSNGAGAVPVAADDRMTYSGNHRGGFAAATMITEKGSMRWES